MRLSSVVLLSVFALTACSSDHALAGNWTQVTGSAAVGATLTFSGDGTKLAVHGAPRADGGHDHPTATFTFDAGSKALTIKGALLGAGQPDSWAGMLAGDEIELTGGTTKVKFKKGGAPAGH